MVGEVGNKANTAQLVVGVKVGAELGKNMELVQSLAFSIYKSDVE